MHETTLVEWSDRYCIGISWDFVTLGENAFSLYGTGFFRYINIREALETPVGFPELLRRKLLILCSNKELRKSNFLHGVRKHLKTEVFRCSHKRGCDANGQNGNKKDC
jgi:hypothetical protein